MKFYLSVALLLCSTNILFSQDTQTKMAPVVVAARHLSSGESLSEDSLKLDQWPAAIVPEGHLGTIDQANGFALKTNVAKGMPVMQRDLRRDDRLQIPIGFKVVAIKVDLDDAVNGLLNPGDYVDVIGVFSSEEQGQTYKVSKTFLKEIKVFSIDKGLRDRTIVGLLVNNEQSEELVLASKDSVSLKLVLRGSPVTAGGNAMISESKTIELRGLARRLDNEAADLEDLGEFQFADRIREMAHEIRLKVRTHQ